MDRGVARYCAALDTCPEQSSKGARARRRNWREAQEWMWRWVLSREMSREEFDRFLRMRDVEPRKCLKCGVAMVEGQALLNSVAGFPDFEGDRDAVTLSRSGRADLVKVWKCPECGRSLT